MELNTHARLLSRAAGDDESKKAKVKSFVGVSEKLDRQLRTAQSKERERDSGNLSDEEEAETDVQRKTELKKKKAVSRKAARDDQTSAVLYQMKSANKYT